MIALRVLGSVELLGPDGREYRAVLTHPKRIALLTYLAAVSPHRYHRRDSLLALFWPELDQERARAALRQALHGLRHVLGAEVIVSRGDEDLAVDEARLWNDVSEFERARAGGDGAAALVLYRGDLLEGFFLSGAPAFERWLEDERSRLRRAAYETASTLARRQLDVGDRARAAEFARRALALSPDDEDVLRQLLEVLDALGDRAGALTAYEGFARRLAAEFEAEPAAETQALITAIRARHVARAATPPAAGATAHDAGSLPPPTPVPTPDPARVRTAPRSYAPIAGVIAAGLLLAVGALVGSWAVAHPGTTAGPRLQPRRIVVVPFDNRTGDDSLQLLGTIAADWISRGLWETRLLEVADIGVASAGDSVPRRTGTLATLAAGSGAGTVVSGSFYRVGDSVRFDARVTDATRGTLLRYVDPVIGPVEQPLQVVERLRQRVTGSLATLFDPKLTEWASVATQPPSLDAYRELLAGVEAADRLDARDALRHFYRAAAQDPTYSLPLVRAATVHRRLRECGATDSIARALAPSRDRLPRLERYTLDKAVAECHGDLMTVYRLSRLLPELLPGTDFAAANLGRDALFVNRPREAVAALERVDPERGSIRGNAPYYLFLTSALHLLGQHTRELRAAQRAVRQYPDNIAMRRLELLALAALGRERAVDQQIEELSALPPHPLRTPGAVMRETALELQAHGHAAAGARVLARTLAWWHNRPVEEAQTESARFELAQCLHAAGRWREAWTILDALVAEHPDSVSYRGLLGVVAARGGDVQQAREQAGWLGDVERPYARGDPTYWRAAIAAGLGERERAVSLLGNAFAQGLPFGRSPGRDAAYGPALHADPNVERLRDYRPFRELLRPKG